MIPEDELLEMLGENIRYQYEIALLGIEYIRIP
jgi:hypothetical protein